MASKKPHKAKPSSGGTRAYGRSKRPKNPCRCDACRANAKRIRGE